MPFTLSHAAAALPFRRTRLILSALIIGTFAPDFEYFLLFDRGQLFGHTLPGAFALDLPLVLTVFWLYQRFVRTAATSLLPDPLRLRIDPNPKQYRVTSPATLALLCVSALVGIATHLGWDQFTHVGTWPYDHWEFFHHWHQIPILGPLQNYKILQHASTLVGAAILALWTLTWYRRTPPRQPNPIPATPNRYTIVLAFLAVALLTGWARAWIGRSIFHSFLGRWVVTFIPVLWLELLAYAIWLDRRRRPATYS